MNDNTDTTENVESAFEEMANHIADLRDNPPRTEEDVIRACRKQAELTLKLAFEGDNPESILLPVITTFLMDSYRHEMYLNELGDETRAVMGVLFHHVLHTDDPDPAALAVAREVTEVAAEGGGHGMTLNEIVTELRSNLDERYTRIAEEGK